MSGYSPSTLVPHAAALIESYTTRSREVTAAFPHRVIPYGDHPDEWSIVFPAGPDAPLHAFVHGGYWQELSAHDSTFMAPGFLSRGIAFAAVNYTLAPACSLDDIVDQCRRAVRHLAETTRSLHLSGHSAGAQLVAMSATEGARSATLLSGVYELEPLVHTPVNDAVGLDLEAARRNSPLFRPRPSHVALLVAIGEHETAEFHRQSRELAARWTPDANVLVAGGRNHFDVVFDVADLTSDVGRAVDRLMTYPNG